MRKLTTKEEVYDLLSASTASAALGAAIETGLLWSLAEQPLEAEQVAQALRIPLKRCRYWLQLLHSLGLLDKNANRYEPSALARTALLDSYDQEIRAYMALEERERTDGVHNLPLFIGAPASVWTVQGLEEPTGYVEKLKRSPERARAFTRMLYEMHLQLADELAARLDLSGARRLLDLGGGSGVVSMALVRKYPHLTATVLDIENVCRAGQDLAEQNGLADRITYLPADLNAGEFPGGFDAVIQCDVGVFEEAFFRKLWAALNPGGRLVLVEHLSPAEDTPPAATLEWTFLESLEDPDYSIPTVPQVRERLIRAGFRLLPGEPALPDDRVILQARKIGELP